MLKKGVAALFQLAAWRCAPVTGSADRALELPDLRASHPWLAFTGLCKGFFNGLPSNR
jgi:hypothetical protein